MAHSFPRLPAVLVLVLLAATACRPRGAYVPAPPLAAAPAPAPAAPAHPTAAPLVIRNARILTAAGVVLERGEMLVGGGVVRAIGARVDAPADAIVLDAMGKTVTPGIIDTHSHIGVYASPGIEAHRDGNEAVSPVTAHVRAGDGYWPQDPQIDSARAGGITTMQILPGSANLIGGRSVVVKTYPGARSVDEARFVGAPEGLKMACGENPKRVYGQKGGPQTRMGNIAGFRRAFQEAVEYRRKWDTYRQKLDKHARNPKKGDKDDGPPEPPGVDQGLETLARVLSGEILVQNHCYRADEMALMMKLAESFGFRIRSFHHAVEAYKVADLLAAHGASASVWADWYGFKAESYDGIRENAAIVAAAGGRAVIHSDSAIGIQHLNQEAAKAMYAGRRAGIEISEDEALRWITFNPAWALGIHDRVGTLESGKIADFVIWDGNPFSVYTRVEKVFIEGALVYDRDDGKARPRTDFDLGHRPEDLAGGGK